MIKESDWKIFTKIKKEAIEKYCSNALTHFSEIIENESEPAYNRCLKLYKLVHARDKNPGIFFTTTVDQKQKSNYC